MKYKLIKKLKFLLCATAFAVVTMAAISDINPIGQVYATEINPADDDGNKPAPTLPPQAEPTPSAIQTDLYESYSGDYGLYEESINNMFFFYANTANGSMSSTPVYFDIPKNIDYSLELDGDKVKYTSKNEIKKEGNYVLRLTAKYEDSTYISTFRFSIRQAVNKPADPAPADNPANNNDNLASLPTNDPNLPNDGDDDGITADDMVIDPNETISDEEVQGIIENAGNDLDTSSSNAYLNGENVNDAVGFRQEFEFEKGLYTITLRTGDVININVPAGAIVNKGVIIEMPPSFQATVYKDGEPYDCKDNYNFTDPGFYTVWFNAATGTFGRFYPEEKDYPFITFRILESDANDIDVFNAPANCKITAVSFEGSPYRADAEDANPDNKNFNNNNDSFWLDEEGTYEFTIFDSSVNKDYKVSVRRDLTPPEFVVNSGRNVASLDFSTNDIAKVELYKDGQELEYKGVVNGAGKYHVKVYDKAGNLTEADFEVKGGLNTGTLSTILLIILFAITGYVHFKLKKTYLIVR